MTAEEIFRGETYNIEFKEQIPVKSEKYMKTIVAFANGTGGRMVFGVEDRTWNVVGFSNNEIFQKMDAVTSAIYDSCEPQITPNVAIQEIDGKAVIVVEILPGMQRPYYVKSLGMSDGTFVRVAGTTRHAERYRLQELILDGTNRSYDQLKTDVPVSDKEIENFCNRMYQHALELCRTDDIKKQLQKVGKSQLISWKLLIEQSGNYYPTNGYLLLDGQSDAYSDVTVQCAVFKGVIRDIFITRKEFGGSIYQQIEDAYSFVLQNINLGSRIEGLRREDIYELPVKTIREVIANAVCHRSYLMPGKIQVALFDDRLEVTSPGMLDDEITIEKMMSGLSKIRNKGIASAFSYMNMIEAWGSGIPRMFREAQEYGLPEPQLLDMGSDFRVNLYRRNMEIDQYGIVDPSAQNGVSDTNDTNADTNDTNADTNDTNADTNDIEHQTFIELILADPLITQKRMQEQTGLSLSTVKRIMAELQKNGRVVRVGNNRSGKWYII